MHRVAGGALFLVAALFGCGRSQPAASFSLLAVPAAVSVTNNGASGTLSVGVQGANGFSGPVQLTLSGIPAGITVSPATVSTLPGQVGVFTLLAKGATVQTDTLVVNGTAGSLAQSATVPLQVDAAQTTAELSATSYAFGQDVAGSTLARQVVTVTNTGSSPLRLNPAIAGDPSFSVAAGAGCQSTLAAGASCKVTVDFAPSAGSPARCIGTLNLGFSGAVPNTPDQVALTGTTDPVPSGTVTPTANPQVALYTVNLPMAGSVTVNFGPDLNYGRSTFAQSTAVAGPVSLFVVGMLGQTTYHMQATLVLSNGNKLVDADRTFTTGAPLLQPQLNVTTAPGAAPQPGVEQLTFIAGNTVGLVVTDLAGRTLWSYAVANPGTGNQIQGAKLLANGDFLVTLGQASNLATSSTVFQPGNIDSIREIDPAGDIVRQITNIDLTAELAARGYNLTLEEFHHDVEPLPNGHWLVLANVLRDFTDLPGYPGTTSVLGDVLIDLDPNLQPVWVWNSFDHLDVNRHPFAFPDWTHSNAVVYSPSDGALLLSMRHQNWVLKIDYANGTGAGDILWRLGEGGDFALLNGVDPTDWFYAQHFPSFFSSNTAGTFSLGLVDNGDDRAFPAGVSCNTAGAPACLYTTVPVFQLNESAKTATLTTHLVLDPTLYSYFGGNVAQLRNGNIEYDLSGEPGGNSAIYEVTPGTGSKAVWQMQTAVGDLAYRGYRLPSLYPGVQW